MSLKIDPFKIVVLVTRKSYSLKVEQSYLSENKEVFTISGRNGSIQVQSNRPLIKADPYSKKKPDWKAVNAKVEQAAFFEAAIFAIQTHISKLEHPHLHWLQHSKNLLN